MGATDLAPLDETPGNAARQAMIRQVADLHAAQKRERGRG